MSFEVEGVLHKKFETEQKTETFRAREFVVTIEQGAYPQYVKFQLVQDRCDLIDEYNEGDRIKVYFDLRGREWNEKYFTNLSCWRLEAAKESSDPVQSADFPTEEPPGASNREEGKADDFDDLPF